MSEHQVPIVDDPVTGVFGLVELLRRELREPVAIRAGAAGSLVYAFIPDLTADETTALADCIRLARSHVSLTLAEFQAIKADLATGRAFLGLTSPTQAQAVAAEKAIIRVLGALLRDS